LKQIKNKYNLIQDTEKKDKGFEKEEELMNQEKKEIKTTDGILPVNEKNEIFEQFSQKAINNSELSLMNIPKEIELLNKIFNEKKQKHYTTDYINYNL